MKLEARSNLSILVVDDDELTLRTHIEIAEMLEVKNVVGAANGKEAIHEIERDDSAFDAILLDVLMPETDGIELFAYMNDRELRIPIIVVTGAPNDVAIMAGKIGEVYSLPIIAVVRKPLSSNVLNALLEELS